MAKAPATKKKQEVATTEEQVPDFLKGKMGHQTGSEEVGGEDLTIPRIELVQSLSKCRKKTEPSYIPGIEEGMLYNNVTREIYGEQITVVPVYFRKEFLLWRDQDLGGGFGGSFESANEAESERKTFERPDEWEVVSTNQQFVLVLKEDGTVEEAVLSMAKSKNKVSKNWNSLIRINGGPRFSRKYVLKGIPDQNSAGQDYYNLMVENAGFVDKDVFEMGQSVYDLIKSGAVKVDSSYEDAEEVADSDM